MNLICAAVLFSMYLKLKKTSSTLCNYKNKIKLSAKLKFLLAFYFILFYLLKTRKNLFFFGKLSNKFLSLKKIFSKIFCLKTYRPYILFLNTLLSRYSSFYKLFVPSYNNLFFIKYNSLFLKSVGLKILNLYRKFSTFKIGKILLKKGFVGQYCRNVLNFKKIQRTKFFSTLKKCLLFLKKKNTFFTYKDKLPFYLVGLGPIYHGYLGHILGGDYLNKNDTAGVLSFLFLKSTFFNFLKSLNALNLFYKECYYNIHIKKIKYNFYITVTNRKGDVIFSNSSGKVGLLKKKQKKSMLAIDLVVRPIIKALLRLNILSIKNFFCPITLRYVFLSVKYFFLRLGVVVNNVIIFNNKPHNFYYKKLKKMKRV